MLSKLVSALRVFVQSLLGERSDAALPRSIPLTPTLAERFGKPLPHPRLEIQAPLAVDECLRRMRSALGRGTIDVQQSATRTAHPEDPPAFRLRLTGKYRLPGLLQRQILQGELDPNGPGTRVVLHLIPRSENAGLGQLLSAVGIAVIVCFVFLTWITGPSEISLLTVATLSVPIGGVTGALMQGLLNTRGNLKERRRLTRTAARLATLLGGTVVRWP